MKQSHSTRTKRKAIANIHQSCSDSPAIANLLDGVFGTDKRFSAARMAQDYVSVYQKLLHNLSDQSHVLALAPDIMDRPSRDKVLISDHQNGLRIS